MPTIKENTKNKTKIANSLYPNMSLNCIKFNIEKPRVTILADIINAPHRSRNLVSCIFEEKGYLITCRNFGSA